MPTIREIAAKAGYSPATVSRPCLSDSYNLRCPTKTRT
ncbi:LacI family DNA-binding transcriptional regulator [Lactiplantibacillus plantarum]|nr:LacI family DNA-binding transcriptional regulator [Lactiplantibacillus plantarum]MCI1170659.1 LacI family DNA-binding transcriptional regulator [Lactiplantibacillus plantarum]MCW8148891.1 LacI family DNA-binding transcriptional regulator [Lactiplantibacillus plantarum]UVO47205.1 LacI family DNA-binding transcriptional regulator [Lactiplantibacillus plantarum]